MGGTRSFGFAAFTDAAIWMLTTAIAIYFILKGKVQLHRQWMTRSFAVAIVFLEVRVALGVAGLEKLGDSVDETVVWMCAPFLFFSRTSSYNGRIFGARAPLQQEFSQSRQRKTRRINIP
jgi:hypothetical protein